MREKRIPQIAVIGAGINGLVAAHYLKKSGFRVTIFDRNPHVGGACTMMSLSRAGKTYRFPHGASVLGFMQDFVFKETGLARRLKTYVPEEEILCTKDLSGQKQTKASSLIQPRDFVRDQERVRELLISGFRSGRPPRLAVFKKKLGPKLSNLWITGTAEKLLQHYKLEPPAAIHAAMSVNESGPVSIREPYSAFTIPLMSAGSVFGGAWGYVKGGIWTVPQTLARINKELGVKHISAARILAIKDNLIRYRKSGIKKMRADIIVFATDPLTAAACTGEKMLSRAIGKQRMEGSSGKIILFFKEPVRWRDGKDPAAFRFIVPVRSLREMDSRIKSEKAFTPAYFEIYGEGAARRKMGERLGYDYVSVFFKSMRGGKKGAAQPRLRRRLEKIILSSISNKESFVMSQLFTPRDLQQLFYFPKGNIDHTELCAGQTFFQRSYSPRPLQNFYQFGSRPDVFYCGAGAYPCGSVAGTAGYMCAKEIIRKLSGHRR